MGVDIEGATQQAPQPGLQEMDGDPGFVTSIKR
jgi:hypothetical protein